MELSTVLRYTRAYVSTQEDNNQSGSSGTHEHMHGHATNLDKIKLLSPLGVQHPQSEFGEAQARKLPTLNIFIGEGKGDL